MARFFKFIFISLLWMGVAVRADVPAPGVTMPDYARQALAQMAKDAQKSNLARMLQSRKQLRPSNQLSAFATPVQVAVPLLLGHYSDSVNRFSRDQFQDKIFDNNPNGTMIDYYSEVSYGQFELSGETFGWYEMPQKQNFYVGNKSGLGGGGARFARDLAVAADPDVDYSQYDSDGDGYVDVIMVVHTGAGAETGESSNIWSHRWSLNGAASANSDIMPQGEYVTDDPWPGHPGKFMKVNDYIIQPELAGSSGGLIEIGVFCHEFGHALGLPDLYDTDYSSEGIGNWGLMAGGSYGGDGNHAHSPSHMCAWSKEFLGWISPTVVEMESLTVSLLNIEENRDAVYKVHLNGEQGSEYFLLENRQKIGFDRYLRGDGLLIWHIDQDVIDSSRRSNSVNNNEHKKGVDLEEADGLAQLDTGQSRGDAGDPFPGLAKNHLFNSSSNPNSDNNDGENSGVAVQISDPVDRIINVSFLLKPELFVTPMERMVSYDSGQVAFSIRNHGGGFMNWNVTTTTPWLSITQNPSGVNKGEVVVSYEANTSDEPRTGYVTVATEGGGNAELRITQMAAGEWILAMTLEDRGGESGVLEFGQLRGASEGIDEQLGEAALPDVPPSGTFDVRLELVDGQSSSLRDFRTPDAAMLQWRMKFQAGSGGYPISLSWDKHQLPGGNFIIQDEFTGTLITVDMKETENYVVPTSSIKSLKITYTVGEPQVVSMISGWNLISLPYSLNETNPRRLFPQLSSSIFTYDGAYVSVDALEPGRGYWIKSSIDIDYSFFGKVVSPAELSVREGWNLIGPFEKEVQVSAILSQPSGILDSDFIGFDDSYNAVDVLQPGRGYWVKVTQDGALYLGSEPTVQKRHEKLKNAATLTFIDARGRTKELYVTADNVSGFHLPPLPPGKAWDVRFDSDRQVCTAGEKRDVLIRGAAYPMTVSISNAEAFDLKLNGMDISQRAEPAQANAIVIDRLSRLELSTELIPADFHLDQNYPNPFNPLTAIQFDLPEDADVLLQVFNARGQLVETLVTGRRDAGHYKIQYDASALPSGVYLYSLRAGKFTATKKMILLR